MFRKLLNEVKVCILYIKHKFLEIILLLFVLIFFGRASVILIQSNYDLIEKYNTLSQMTYTLLTAVLVIFTFKALQQTQKQKHFMVRPFDFDFCRYNSEKINNFMCYVRNEGVGLALNVDVSMVRKIDSKTVYGEFIPRISVQDNKIRNALIDIDNSIRRFSKETPQITTVYEDDAKEIEFYFDDNVENYYSLEIILIYDDIYGKQYKSIFEIDFDTEADEFTKFTEKVSEIG